MLGTKLNRVGWLLVVAALAGGCVDADIEPRLEALADSGVGCEEDDRVGEPCFAGEGSCRQAGEYVCTASGVVCDAAALSAVGRQELCGTGRDEDCDGTFDEAPDGRCCDDGDCGGGTCVIPLVGGGGKGGGIEAPEASAQGGTCLGDGAVPCGASEPCTQPGFTCVDGLCEEQPQYLRSSAVFQSTGGGLTSGSGYTLQLRIGSPGPMGTTGGGGKVMRIGPMVGRNLGQ